VKVQQVMPRRHPNHHEHLHAGCQWT
jgi:hypothetical protein